MPMQRKAAYSLLLLLATSALAATADPATSGFPTNTSAPAHAGSPHLEGPKPAANPAPMSSPLATAPSTSPALPKPAAATMTLSPAAPAQKPAAVEPNPAAAASPSRPVTPSFLGFRVASDGAASAGAMVDGVANTLPPRPPTPPPPSPASPPPRALTPLPSAAAALQDSHSTLSPPQPDAVLTAAASTVSSAAASAGLLRLTAPLQTTLAAQAPVHSAQPAAKPPTASLATEPLSGAVVPMQAKGLAAARLKVPAGVAPSPAELLRLKREQEAHQNMQAARQMVDRIESHALAPQAPLSTVPAPPVPQQAPVQVNTAYTGAKSAVSMVIRISGQGVTPFTTQKQQQLINVFVDATAGNMSASQFSVLLVSSAYSSRRRSMLQAPIVTQGSKPQGAPLSNVADVTLEVNAGTPGNAAAIRNQLAALISSKTYLNVALQRAGLDTWSIKLLTISIVQPSQSSSGLPCQKPFGKWCLDRSGLTLPLAILIIAFGGAVLVFTVILILVIREVKKNNGKTAALEYPKSDSVTTNTHVLKYVIGKDAQPSPSKA